MHDLDQITCRDKIRFPELIDGLAHCKRQGVNSQWYKSNIVIPAAVVTVFV